jgi:hypothetical protein
MILYMIFGITFIHAILEFVNLNVKLVYWIKHYVESLYNNFLFTCQSNKLYHFLLVWRQIIIVPSRKAITLIEFYACWSDMQSYDLLVKIQFRRGGQISLYANIVKPVYKGHSLEPENMPFLSSCLLYTGHNYMHCPLIGKMRQSFIDSDFLYRSAL